MMTNNYIVIGLGKWSSALHRNFYCLAEVTVVNDTEELHLVQTFEFSKTDFVSIMLCETN